MKKIKSILFILFLLSFNLSADGQSDDSWDCKLPDEIGNLFKTYEKTDRKYGRTGQLLKDETYSYSYDEVGNLIEKESIAGTWKYRWSQGGMLKQVVRPDNKKVDFTYDALGRRLTKTYQDQTTHFVWDGNVPLHEWTSSIDETITSVNENGEAEISIPENLTTWIFEDGIFIPMAKLHGDKSYSIITDHLGTPTEAYDEEGQKVWSRELGIYGQTRKETGVENFVPFKYQGQYEDSETGLCDNRFRYYDSSAGLYISQDPIRLNGDNSNFYAYTFDSNSVSDPFGLAGTPWHPHGAAQPDIPSKGVHFYAGDGVTELKMKVGANGDLGFEEVFTKDSGTKKLQEAINEANEKLLNDKSWRKKLLQNAGDVKNSLFNNFNRLDRAQDVKKIEKALKALDKACG